MATKQHTTNRPANTALAEQIITNLVLLAVGVLFCLGTKVDLIVGIALCLYGAITIILLASKNRSLFSGGGIFGGVMIALGISFIVGSFLQSFVQITPYVLCAVGGVFLLDAFLAKFQRKDVKTAVFVIELVIGAACLALGLCLLFVDGIKGYERIIFGVSLIVFAAYRLVVMILKKR